MEEEGTNVLKLNIGNPAPFGFRTPDEVIYDMRQQLTECEGYSAAKGLFAARKAIMQYAQLKTSPMLPSMTFTLETASVSWINLCMSALLDTGDEILIPSPDYLCGLPALLWQEVLLFIISVTNSLNGIRILRISKRKSQTRQKLLLSSIRIILQEHFIRRRFFSRS